MQEFDRVYQEHCGEIFKFLYRIVGSEAEARELTQETFLAFLKEIRTVEMPLGKQRPWLYRVAKNKALNIKRDKHRFASTQQKIGDSSNANSSAFTEGNKTPEKIYSQVQEREFVHIVLAQMKEKETSLLQYYMAGLNYIEIATALEVERSTIGKALARAKESFRSLYQQIVGTER